MTWRHLAQSVKIAGDELRNPDPSGMARLLYKRLSHLRRFHRREQRLRDDEIEQLIAAQGAIIELIRRRHLYLSLQDLWRQIRARRVTL